jgi:hypothetical protein
MQYKKQAGRVEVMFLTAWSKRPQHLQSRPNLLATELQCRERTESSWSWSDYGDAELWGNGGCVYCNLLAIDDHD